MSDKRVAVGMSGGVDSSVAAAILKEKGYEVIGLTMQLSTPASRCCSDEDVQDARRVAKLLQIPHFVVPMHIPFKKSVIDYFISEYQIGRTPNPCAVCNPLIKFGTLLEKARSLNTDLLATGHYAMLHRDKISDRILLKRGKEKGKDQSYFLARLTQEKLKHILFPVGSFPKHKIRSLAEKMQLPVAQKSDSQEVCFIPESGVSSFINEQGHGLNPPGTIKDKQGNVMGTHQGIIGFTIGQRKGLGIATGEPVYVTEIDSATHTIIIGADKDLYHTGLVASHPNWITGTVPKTPLEVQTRIRHQHRPAHATLYIIDDNTIRIEFKTPQRAITPGQLAVFYQRDVVVGSAWIDRAESTKNKGDRFEI